VKSELGDSHKVNLALRLSLYNHLSTSQLRR